MKSFFKTCVSSIKTSGTIKPSSKKLINTCLKNLDFSKYNTIVELGPGDGCVTAEIISRMNGDTKLFSIEINEAFYAHCTQRFSDIEKDIVFHKGSAFELQDILHKNGIDKVDCIVSSLPLSLFKKEQVEDLLRQVKVILGKEGKYVQYQYSLMNYTFFKRVFSNVNLDMTLVNFPPAFVYHCVV